MESESIDRTEEGRFLLSCLWMELVKRLLDFVIEHYSLSEVQAKELKEQYGKPGLYRVVLTD